MVSPTMRLLQLRSSIAATSDRARPPPDDDGRDRARQRRAGSGSSRRSGALPTASEPGHGRPGRGPRRAVRPLGRDAPAVRPRLRPRPDRRAAPTCPACDRGAPRWPGIVDRAVPGQRDPEGRYPELDAARAPPAVGPRDAGHPPRGGATGPAPSTPTPRPACARPPPRWPTPVAGEINAADAGLHTEVAGILAREFHLPGDLPSLRCGLAARAARLRQRCARTGPARIHRPRA